MLLEEYCSLTGRPVATITVDEFVKLGQFAAEHSPLSERKNPAPSPLPEKTEEISDRFLDRKELIVDNTADAPVVRPEREPRAMATPTGEEPKAPKRSEPKKDLGGALALLKSISG